MSSLYDIWKTEDFDPFFNSKTEFFFFRHPGTCDVQDLGYRCTIDQTRSSGSHLYSSQMGRIDPLRRQNRRTAHKIKHILGEVKSYKMGNLCSLGPRAAAKKVGFRRTACSAVLQSLHTCAVSCRCNQLHMPVQQLQMSWS